MQSIPNQFLPVQDAHRAALKPSESRWSSASTGSRCQTPRIGSLSALKDFYGKFSLQFFGIFFFFSSPCHFPILWCFSSTKHEWPDPFSRANPQQKLSSLAFGALFILYFRSLFSISFLWLSSALFYQSLLVAWKENLKFESHWSICWMPPLVKL